MKDFAALKRVTAMDDRLWTPSYVAKLLPQTKQQNHSFMLLTNWPRLVIRFTPPLMRA